MNKPKPAFPQAVAAKVAQMQSQLWAQQAAGAQAQSQTLSNIYLGGLGGAGGSGQSAEERLKKFTDEEITAEYLRRFTPLGKALE